MSTAGAVAIALVIIGIYMSAVGTKAPSRLLLASPTTVIPAFTAVLVGALAVGIGLVAGRLGINPVIIAILILAALAIGVRAGGTTAPTRIVYERGATIWAPGEMIGAVVLGLLILLAVGRAG